jgi:hypothetical protein
MLNENLNPIGTVVLELRDEFGNIKQYEESNLVVNLGLAYIASRMKDATATAMSHMAVGTSSTAAAAAQTALVAEIARVALSSTTIVTTTVANDAIQFQATFPAGTGTGALTEAAILNAGAAGTMLNRVVFSVINKGALDSLTITWKVTIQ